MVNAVFLFVVVVALCLCSNAAADCVNLAVVPLASQSVKESKGNVCGYTHLVVQKKGGKSLVKMGIDESWYKPGFTSTKFKPVAFPLGFKATCPQHAPKEDITLWSGISSVYVRREFEVTAESLKTIKEVLVKYIVDDKLVNAYVNGKQVSTGTRRPAKGCAYWAGTNSFIIPPSYLEAGKNVLAIEAVNTGGPCYLDLGLSFKACTENTPISELHPCSPIEGPGAASRGCRARCAEKNFCRNKDPKDCGPSFHADMIGSCFCEASESLSCSGEINHEPAGVCYPNTWMPSHVSRVAFCPPRTETMCRS